MDHLFSLGKEMLGKKGKNHGSHGNNFNSSYDQYGNQGYGYNQPPYGASNQPYGPGSFQQPYGYNQPPNPSYGYSPAPPPPNPSYGYSPGPPPPNHYGMQPGMGYGANNYGGHHGSHHGGFNPMAKFKAFDRDGDGQITENDFVIAVRDMGMGHLGETMVRGVFRSLDKNRNGRLDLNEAMAAFGNLNKGHGHGHNKLF